MAEEGDGKPKTRGRVENLHPKTSAAARGKLGGIASGKARQQRKLVSQVVADWLLKEHSVPQYDPNTGKIVEQKMSTDELLDHAMTRVLARGDGATATMLKTIAEINEGKTVNLPGLTLNLSPEQREARIAELEAKRKKRGKK